MSDNWEIKSIRKPSGGFNIQIGPKSNDEGLSGAVAAIVLTLATTASVTTLRERCMKTFSKTLAFLIFALPLAAQTSTKENTLSGLPPCPQGTPSKNWTNCDGKVRYPSGATYEGAYIDGKHNGIGKYVTPDGVTYEGNHRDNKRNGRFVITYADGKKREATYEDNQLKSDQDLNRPQDRLTSDKPVPAPASRVGDKKQSERKPMMEDRLSTAEANQSKLEPALTALQDVSRNMWAEVKFGGCTPSNMMRWKYDPVEGLMIYQWKNESIDRVLSHPRQNQQKTEYQFLSAKSPKTQFIYREKKFAQGNGPIEVMTGNPNTLIYDYTHAVTLENKNSMKIEQNWNQSLDTKALFDSRTVRYEKKSPNIMTLERCN
jgi:hypothetical protein